MATHITIFFVVIIILIFNGHTNGLLHGLNEGQVTDTTMHRFVDLSSLLCLCSRVYLISSLNMQG